MAGCPSALGSHIHNSIIQCGARSVLGQAQSVPGKADSPDAGTPFPTSSCGGTGCRKWYSNHFQGPVCHLPQLPGQRLAVYLIEAQGREARLSYGTSTGSLRVPTRVTSSHWPSEAPHSSVKRGSFAMVQGMPNPPPLQKCSSWPLLCTFLPSLFGCF